MPIQHKGMHQMYHSGFFQTLEPEPPPQVFVAASAFSIICRNVAIGTIAVRCCCWSSINSLTDAMTEFLYPTCNGPVQVEFKG